MEIIIFICTGIIIGILSGLLGIGGGLVAVPALSMIFQLENVDYNIIMHLAVGSSLASIIVTAIVSIYAYNKQKNIDWKITEKLLPSIIIGTIIGSVFSQSLSTARLKIIFGIFVMFIALRILFGRSAHVEKDTVFLIPKRALLHLAGFATGILAGLIGIGGSVLIIPFLLFYGLTMRQASGTSISCALPMAIIGTACSTLLGWHANNLPPYSLGYVNWAAALGLSIPSVFSVHLGTKLAKILPQEVIKRIFAVFLIIVSTKMLFFP